MSSDVHQFVPVKRVGGVISAKVAGDSAKLINNSYYGVKWPGTSSACIRTGALEGVAASMDAGNALLPCHAAIKRCVINDKGEEQYFLDGYNRLGHTPTITGTDDVGTASKVSDVGVFVLAESEYKGKYVHNKTNDTYALITAKDSDDVLSIDENIFTIGETFEICTAGVGYGGDGQVVQKIDALHYRYFVDSDGYPNWDISTTPFEGSIIHHAFKVGNEYVPYIYRGVFEGSMYDASAGGMVAPADIAVNMYAAGDKLCSLAGEFPKTYETRDEFRKMANQRGLGWSLESHDDISLMQLLYLIRYADFNSQAMIGAGRTALSGGTWTAGSYIGKCGKSLGDGTSPASVGGNTDDAYCSVDGEENPFGNVWKYFDGLNINNHIPYVSNDPTDWQDDTDENYLPLDVTLPTSTNYQASLLSQDRGFLPKTVGAVTTLISDYYWQATGWRVVLSGALAADGALAGAFALSAHYDSAYPYVNIGGRLVYKPVTKATKEYEHLVAMTDDTAWTGAVPVGYLIESIIFVNSSANAATLDLGTIAGGEDVFEQQVIAASGITTVVLNKVLSMSARTSLYINDDGVGTWNSASLTAVILMRRALI